jgi:hypothetical protein
MEAMTLSKMTVSKMTLRIIGLIATPNINAIQSNNTQHKYRV